MYHLKLIKGRSYSGAVRATAKNPDVFTEDGAVRDAALASGYFEEVGAAKAAASDPEIILNEPEEPVMETTDHATELSKMTVEELKAYASINGIPLGSSKKREAVLKAVLDAEEKAAKIRAELREK